MWNLISKKTLSIILLLTLTCFIHADVFAQSANNKVLKDFRRLTKFWEGTLTYLDYSSGEEYTMLANVYISRISHTTSYVFEHTYPNESSANAVDTVVLSEGGKLIGNEVVISRKKLKNGNIEIITEEEGVDGNDDRQATFRHTYIIGHKLFIIRKEVQFIGESNWIMRHEYSYTTRGK